MSDVDIQTPAAQPAATPSAPDTAATSSAEPQSSAPETDVFADFNADKYFGLEQENGQPDPATSDVKATDQPVSRQDAKKVETKSDQESAVGNEADPDNPDGPQTDSTQETKDATNDGFQFNEKLNWENGNGESQVPFREEFNALKQAYLSILESSVETQFVNSPTDFAAWMKETSPTSYNQVGGMLATESAKAHPEQWIDFLLNDTSNADLIAQKITGREDMTAERLKAELEVILDEDDPDVQAVMERNQSEAADKAANKTEQPETPEQKRIRELLEKEDQREAVEFRSKVFGPVENAVNALISQAGLEITDAELEGKSLQDLDPETKFKAVVNDLMPVYIGMRADADPRLKNMQARLDEFIKNKDLKSALSMQHAIKIAVTNIANEFLEIVTAQRAKAKAQDDLPPTNGNPPPIVRSAGASTSPASPLTGPLSDDDWKVTEADLVRR